MRFGTSLDGSGTQSPSLVGMMRLLVGRRFGGSSPPSLVNWTQRQKTKDSRAPQGQPLPMPVRVLIAGHVATHIPKRDWQKPFQTAALKLMLAIQDR